MIKTSEALIDPVDYFHANPEALNTFAQGEPGIFSGTDFDVLVTGVGPGEPLKRGRIEQEVHSVLGSLYPTGSAFGEQILGQTVDLEWYLSPDAVNRLVTQLGMEPGVDVLRFVHAENFGKIPPIPHATYLAKGDYPQATKTARYFRHDRDEDHAVGVLLMPPTVTRAIVRDALWPYCRPKGYEKSSAGWQARCFDIASTAIGRVAKEVYPFLGNKNDCSDLGGIVRSSLLPLAANYFDLDGVKGMRRGKAINQKIGEIIFEHLTDIVPLIHQLKNAA